MNRVKTTVLVVVLAVASAGGGWAAASRISSPAEIAARTAAPEPSPILVPIEQRVLSTDVVTRGTARFGAPQPETLIRSFLKPDAGIVASVGLPGTLVQEGDLMMSASGRPVFALIGANPMYRDLGPGVSGEDVRQLEESLARLGFDPGAIDGSYDEATGAAVSAFYTAAGWEPFGATNEQLAAIRSLERDVVSAKNDLLSSDGAIASARADLAAAKAAYENAGDTVARLSAAVDLERARAKVSDAAAAADVAAKQEAVVLLTTDPASAPDSVAAAEAVTAASVEVTAAQAAYQAALDSVTQATSAITVEQAQADAANAAAQAEVTTKQAVRDQACVVPASAECATAETDLQVAIANANATSLAGAASVQAAVDAKAAADGDVQVAASKLAAAQQTLASAQAEQVRVSDPAAAAKALAGAEADLVVARANAEATRQEGLLAVQKAKDELAAARRDLGSAQTSYDTSKRLSGFEQSMRSNLTVPLSAVEADLQTAQLHAGIQVPADEVIFIPAMPVRIDQVNVAPGDTASGQVLSVTGLNVTVDAQLKLDDAPVVKAGMPVQIDEQSLGISTTGVVSQVAEKPGTHGTDGYHVYLEVAIDNAPASIVGVSVRLTIPVQSTGGEVLAVPISALSLAADGTSRVQVQQGSALQYVTVEPGLSAAGYAEIKPIGATLTPGQLVMVGFQPPSG